jgi:hypothetical protein
VEWARSHAAGDSAISFAEIQQDSSPQRVTEPIKHRTLIFFREAIGMAVDTRIPLSGARLIGRRKLQLRGLESGPAEFHQSDCRRAGAGYSRQRGVPGIVDTLMVVVLR